LKRVKKLIHEAHGHAGMIVFPEYTNFFAAQDISRNDLYEMSDSTGFINEVKSAAVKHQIGVVIGVYERADRPAVHSTVYFIKPDGEIGIKYSKSHLFNAFGSSELERLVPSSDMPAVFEFLGFKFGIMICYEIRFPEIARRMALMGADALIVPSAWYRGFNKEDQWETMVKARAMENTVYVLTSNQIGNSFTGITMVADPAGIVVSRATEEEGLLYAELSRERIDKVRSAMPLLRQRRPELY
ncbi:MAG: nitrilase-related carbon-nitrogen hydrolase, partial [Nitrososphaeria archaeon]